MDNTNIQIRISLANTLHPIINFHYMKMPIPSSFLLYLFLCLYFPTVKSLCMDLAQRLQLKDHDEACET